MNKKTRRIFSIIMAVVIVIIITMFSINSVASASAVEYMKNSAQQRLAIAESRYSELMNNPSKETEVLISFQNTTLDTVDRLLPSGCEVISVYHYFSDGYKTVTGAYVSCKDKDISEIQNKYYTEIYNMLKSNIEALEEEKSAIYNQYMLDFSISSNEFDPYNMNKEWVYQGESLSEIETRIAFNIDHLNSMQNKGLDLRGIRIKAKNDDIIKLLDHDEIKMIEILDFDNNSIVMPVIFK